MVATDSLSGGFFDNVPAEVTWVEGDISDPDFVESLWASGTYDFVYHTAAYAAEGLSHFIRAVQLPHELAGQRAVVNQSVLHGVKRFVFTSSIAVYGAEQTPMTEEMTPRPEDPYGISKYAVELDLAAANDIFGLEYSIFRPHNVYGERQNISDPYRNVIGIFMSAVLRANRCPCSATAYRLARSPISTTLRR